MALETRISVLPDCKGGGGGDLIQNINLHYFDFFRLDR